MQKMIAYSLWGDIPKYTLGAVKNAQDAPLFYPGWTARFYCADSVPADILCQLEQAGADVVRMSGLGDNTAMLWRFYVLEDADVDIAIMRDADSRLSLREAEAVREWLESGLAGHVMRDHPYHSSPIMGGMWGVKTAPFRDIRKRIEAFAPKDLYDQDQRFLEQAVYPELLRLGLCVHDPFYNYEGTARPFPGARENYAFVGEVFDGQGKRGEEWTVLRRYEQSAWRRFRFAVKRALLCLRQHWRCRGRCA